MATKENKTINSTVLLKLSVSVRRQLRSFRDKEILSDDSALCVIIFIIMKNKRIGNLSRQIIF